MKSSPSKKIMQRCIRIFTSFGNLNKKKLTGRPVTVTTQTNIDMVNQIIGGKKSVSLRYLSQKMEVSYSSTQTLVKKKRKVSSVQSSSLPAIATRRFWKKDTVQRVVFFWNSTVNILLEGYFSRTRVTSAWADTLIGKTCGFRQETDQWK